MKYNMISPNELRIGNLVMTTKGARKVAGVSDREITLYCDGAFNAIYYPKIWDQITPIPITEEWLIRLGFIKDGFNAFNIVASYFKNQYRIIGVSGDYIYLREGRKDDPRHKDDLTVLWNNDVRKVIPVHQLQNLYYSLTGEELTIN